MHARIANIFKRENKKPLVLPQLEVLNQASSEFVSKCVSYVYSQSNSVDELRDKLKPIMKEAMIPQDLIDKLTNSTEDPLSQFKESELLLGCYGRLEHLQSVGLCYAATINKMLELKGIKPPNNQIIDVKNLEIEGALSVDPLITSAQIGDVIDWFQKRPCFNGHTPDSAPDRVVHRYVGSTAEQYPFGSYTTHDVVTAPHLLELALSDRVLGAATRHLGCLPTLSALQAWWNFPQHEENIVPGGNAPRYYHRDLNDLRMFWVYIYLTDVDGENGPHMVIRNTADLSVIENHLKNALHDFPFLHEQISTMSTRDFFYQYGYQIPRDVVDNIFKDLEITFTGKAGTTFCSNGFNFHRIKYPLSRKRLLFAARFSINPSINTGSTRDGDPIPGDIITPRVGDSPLIRYVTRKLFNFDKRNI